MFLLKIRRRLIHIALRIVQCIRISWYKLLSPGWAVGRPKLHQPLQVVGSGRVEFQENVNIGVFPSPGFLDKYAYIEARSSSAQVLVGSGTWINNGFSCIAEFTTISIGKNCLIGANVEILDSDFHGLALADRRTSRPEWAAPVVIEDDVFIGSNVRIMKGTRIGRGAVIANSSVVVVDIPAMTIAAGVPAKAIRSISAVEAHISGSTDT